ncbi:MAG: DUF1631 domain-containing protein [Methylococcaceae bacterium]|nr:DUF1631 domain-containing protein [Methylococcaceae bacterium]
MEHNSHETSVDHPSALTRHRELLHTCQGIVVEQFSNLLKGSLTQLNDFLTALALELDKSAANIPEQEHCFVVMYEIKARQAEILQTFAKELARGFDNFASGKEEPLRRKEDNQKKNRLSLIDKDDYELALLYSNMLTNANREYSAQLFALNHRLSIINGGIILGEYNPALPGSPAQVLDGLRSAMEAIKVPIQHKLNIAILKEIDKRLLRKAGEIYDNINEELIRNGILPDLSLDDIGYKPTLPANPVKPPPPHSRPEEDKKKALAKPAAPSSPQTPTFDDSWDEEDEQTPPPDLGLFTEIRKGLARRPNVHPAGHAANVQTDMPELLRSLDSLQSEIPPIAEVTFQQLSLESIKSAYAEQISKLAEIVKHQNVNPEDADIIDLVGMLFEYVLNDNTLPDSVKALLCHLHTPVLKVALLDKKFFYRGKHPTRRLLDAMSQAGALCNPDDGDEHGIFTKMRSIVRKITKSLETNIQIYSDLLEDFNEFLENLEHRSKIQEKRVVETAKGRERLREARLKVSQEIVDRTWDRTLPKPVESLLLGPWANLMVLTYLRNGPNTQEWRRALTLLDDVLWSVTPKSSDTEREQLRVKIPQIAETIRTGLGLIGDPEVDTDTLLDELTIQQNNMLTASQESLATIKSPTVGGGALKPKPLWEDVEVEAPRDRHAPLTQDADTEMQKIIEQLQTIKPGLWFELYDPKKRQKLRAKLSWYSPQTSYYIFVNQAGVQMAIKSVRTLAKEIHSGESRILPMTQLPLMNRAMETINSLLHHSASPDDTQPPVEPRSS